MKNIPASSLLLRILLLLLVTTTFLARLAYGQTNKEIEVEVAGPWDYVADPLDSNRIILIAPTGSHNIGVFEGGDANNYSGDVYPGSYTLTFPFKMGSCAQHVPPPLKSLVPVTIDTSTSPNPVTNALTAKGKRFSISLPKPCYYESYAQARSKVDKAPITPTTPEQSLTTWMALHYTVDASVQKAVLSGSPDDTTISPYNRSLTFFVSTKPPKTMAIALAMYYSAFGEDYDCDQHSADAFDESMKTLWSQIGYYRLFPELEGGDVDGTANQSLRYNYDPKGCPQNTMLATHMVSIPMAKTIRSDVVGVRDHLRESDFAGANEQLKHLKELIDTYWNNKPPKEVLEDIDATATSIALLLDKKDSSQKVNADQFLRLTLHILAPGRADCHAAQFNINGAVN